MEQAGMVVVSQLILQGGTCIQLIDARRPHSYIGAVPIAIHANHVDRTRKAVAGCGDKVPGGAEVVMVNTR